MSSKIVSSGLTGFAFPNAQISATVSGNALTIAIKTANSVDPSPTDPVYFAIRSSLTGVVLSYIIASALTITVPNGATLGAVSGESFRIWIVAFDDNGTIRLGVTNRTALGADVAPIWEDATAAADAISAASGTSGFKIYAPVAVSSKSLRIVGYVTYETALATAGVWNVAPDIVQMFGPSTKRPGDVVQSSLSVVTGAQAGSAIVMPFDNTIPQVSEVNPFVSAVLLNVSRASKLEHIVEFNGGMSVANDSVVLAVYSTGAFATSDMLAASWQTSPGVANSPMQLRLSFQSKAEANPLPTANYMAAIGSSSGGIFTLNGVGAAAKLGGVLLSTYHLKEIMG